MPDANEPDFGPHPNLNREPLQTGLPAETLVDRGWRFSQLPDWIIDRISATWLMLVLVAVILGIGGFVIWFLLNAGLWPVKDLTACIVTPGFWDAHGC